MAEPTTREGLAFGRVNRRVLTAALCLATLGPACKIGETATSATPTVSTDLEGLRRLIELPGPVRRVAWQTGQRAAHGGDWWLAAVLQVDPPAMASFLPGEAREQLVEVPADMRLEADFAALLALPGAQAHAGAGVRLVAPVYGVAPFARAPLLTGWAMRLADERLLLMLWTR